MIIDDYDSMTDDEKREELLFEQYFPCQSNITMEKRDYIFNCLSKTITLYATNIIEMSLRDGNGCILLHGCYSRIGNNYSLRGEIYESGDTLSFDLESENLTNHKVLFSIEEFERKGDVVEHYQVLDEGVRDSIDEIPLSELNFVAKKKSKFR